ncbi:hypothetical protein E2C01_041436 [Portunus trituberculatus]|uniref:Uncharacterized protein n=1 Tax=Portunus trituberculatus TaxID=210409 RepID=A0A5B7FML4_PORTR|nr:hypothetical protein [Portunus trituberculatus]
MPLRLDVLTYCTLDSLPTTPHPIPQERLGSRAGNLCSLSCMYIAEPETVLWAAERDPAL